MATNVEISKQGGESTTTTLRRFTRRMQSSGIVRSIKGRRYYSRAVSKKVRKAGALKLIARREKYEELSKLGKIDENFKKNRRRR